MPISSLRMVPRRRKNKTNSNLRIIAWTEDGTDNVTQITSDSLPPLNVKTPAGVRKLAVTISSSAREDETLLHHLLNRTRGHIVPTRT